MPIEAVRTVEGPLCIVRARGESTLVDVVDVRPAQHRPVPGRAHPQAAGQRRRRDRDPAADDRRSLPRGRGLGARGDGRVAVALVIDGAYIHPEKFGVKAAGHFGLVTEVCAHEADALAWLDGCD
jgi:hypothetical protein